MRASRERSEIDAWIDSRLVGGRAIVHRKKSYWRIKVLLRFVSVIATLGAFYYFLTLL